MDVFFEILFDILFDTAGDSDISPTVRLVVNGVLAVLGAGGGVYAVIYGLAQGNTPMVVIGAVIGAGTLAMTVRNIVKIVRHKGE